VATLASGGPPGAVERVRQPLWEPSFDLAESKLRPPAVRRGLVARTSLLDRLFAASAPSVISVVAPAGYGKTTLLGQWAERKEPRVAWVSLDHRDNDLVVLLTYITVALDRIGPIQPRVFQALASSGAGIEVPRRLVSAMGRLGPITLVIDHFEAVTNPECLDAIAALALGLPEESQLAIGSRDALPLPAARLVRKADSWRSGSTTSRWIRTTRVCSCWRPVSNSPPRTWMSSSARPRAGPWVCTSPRSP
jgi:ATP/maltotriose-dependent transcriptional regulator MalT